MSVERILGYGLCECGCGQRTRVSPRTNTIHGYVAGVPRRFVYGHQRRRTPNDYEVRDMGYKTPCWVWVRSLNHNGYPKTSEKGKDKRGHRVYYERFVGPIPDGLEIDHLCSIRACVNPDHLEAVTPLLNVRRSRAMRLSPEDVVCIRNAAVRVGKRVRSTPTQDELARQFGVSRSYISILQTGRRPIWLDSKSTR